MKRTSIKTKRTHPMTVIGVICIILGVCVLLSSVFVSRFNLHDFCTVHYEEKTYEITQEIHGLDVSVKNVRVTVLPTTENVCRIECDESKAIFYKISVEDSKLLIHRVDERAWFEKIISISFVSPSLTVYLPMAQYDTLSLNTLSGDVQVSGELSFSEADVTTSSGDVFLEAASIETLSVNTGTGRIKLWDFSANDISVTSIAGDAELSRLSSSLITAETRSGDLRLSDTKADSVKVTSVSGKISLSSTVAHGAATVETNTGKVVLSRFDAEDISIETVRGKVSGTLLTEKQFDVQSESGKTAYPESSGEEVCRVRTKSGDVKLEIRD